jgi:hypothetical protein
VMRMMLLDGLGPGNMSARPPSLENWRGVFSSWIQVSGKQLNSFNYNPRVLGSSQRLRG